MGPFIWAKHLSTTFLDKLLAVYIVHLQLINAQTVISKRHSYCITVISVSTKSTSMTAAPKASEAQEVSGAVFVCLHISPPLNYITKELSPEQEKKTHRKKKSSSVLVIGLDCIFTFLPGRPLSPQFSPFKSVFIQKSFKCSESAIGSSSKKMQIFFADITHIHSLSHGHMINQFMIYHLK